MDKYPYSVVPWNRCKEVRPPNDSGYWGRCVLVKLHKGHSHVLYKKPEVDAIPWMIQWKPEDDEGLFKKE